MGFIDHDDTPAAARILVNARLRPRPPRRFVSEFENEIQQLYVGTIDEPIPPRMIEVLRARLVDPKP
jgi:hypothetical protein